jgi:hypothetical protein
MFILSVDPGFKNLAWCVLEQRNDSNGRCQIFVHERHVVNIIGDRSTRKSIPWDLVHRNFKECFLKLEKKYNNVESDWDHFLCHVIIERQPVRGLKNSLLAAHLYTFFNVKFPHTHVNYCNPKLKLKSLTDVLPAREPPDLKKYNERKKEAIRRTQNLIDSENIQIIENFMDQSGANTPPAKPSIGFFDPFKKKDDIADCILNGYVYLQNK